MTNSGTDYTPPLTARMAVAQNERGTLRLLLAQRRLYSQAKRWSFLRWIGFSVIGVGAPIITVAIPSAAVVVGAIAGLWIFLSRTIFATSEQRLAAKAASIQEDFDQLVFGMPALALRDPKATPEEVAQLAGDDADLPSRAAKEHLGNWYPFDNNLNGTASIAIAQRANAAYSERLQKANAKAWLAVTLVWCLAAVVVSLLVGINLPTFILGVALPLLPALLDVTDQWRQSRRAGADRRSLADGIERAIRGQTDHELSGEDLLVWQEQLYGLRRYAPQVPNLVYKRTRKRNERVMHAAARDLGAIAHSRQAQRDNPEDA